MTFVRVFRLLRNRCQIVCILRKRPISLARCQIRRETTTPRVTAIALVAKPRTIELARNPRKATPPRHVITSQGGNCCDSAVRGSGTVKTPRHFGQRIRLPVKDSSTWSRFWHAGQDSFSMIGSPRSPAIATPPIIFEVSHRSQESALFQTA